MQHHLNVAITAINPQAVMPRYATDGSGCFDLFPPADCEPLYVEHGKPLHIDLGVAFEIPYGHVMLVFSRSGHGFKWDVRLANATGIIDNDYRDSVKLKLTCDDPLGGVQLDKTKAVAQAIILPYPRCTFAWRDELSETVRGLRGFGSTDEKRGA